MSSDMKALDYIQGIFSDCNGITNDINTKIFRGDLKSVTRIRITWIIPEGKQIQDSQQKKSEKISKYNTHLSELNISRQGVGGLIQILLVSIPTLVLMWWDQYVCCSFSSICSVNYLWITHFLRESVNVALHLHIFRRLIKLLSYVQPAKISLKVF